LSFSESLLSNGIIEIIALKWFCSQINIWFQIGVAVLLIYANYRVYFIAGRSKALVNAEPAIANSNRLSIFVTWLFFLVTASWLYGRHLLDQYR